jgi:SpoVK/Ycf46/Vps4 family AAA+-type ATPase
MRDPAGIAARYRVGPGVIHRALASCATPADEPCDDAIEAFIRQSRDVRLGDHARRVERLATWSDLVLPPDIMDSLRELVGRVRHRRTVIETWGMGRTLQTSRGITALFQGQPGTGKTLVAGVVARELGLDLYQVDLSKVMSKWLGETERNLAAIFDAAEDGQVILLFDEADSLFAKRTEVRSSNDRYANLEVNYLLQRLDAFEGIAILTTNSGGSIDPAFKRRMSFRLSFPFPDEETREQLWRTHVPAEVPRAGELVFDVLARKYQLSGGYIRNACLRAAFLAAQEESALAQRHLERAVALEFAELGKLSSSGAIE